MNLINIFILVVLLFIIINNNIISIDKFTSHPIKIAVVVPCVPKHIQYLKGLFNSINNQTKLPNKVIISLSGSNDKEGKVVKELYSPILNPSIELIVDCVELKQNAAENRNRSIKHCNDIDYIAFMDADDEMCPNKIKLITDLMILHKADMGLHNYSNGHSNKNEAMCSNGTRVISPEEMAIRESNNRKHLHLSKLSVHHGHPIISKKLFSKLKQNIKYVRGQDSKYVRDTFKHHFRVVYTDAKLSKYFFRRSSGGT